MTPYSSAVTAGVDIYANDINKVRQDIFLGVKNHQIITPTGSPSIVTIDLSNVDNGNVKTINLDRSITLRFSGITKYATAFFVRFKNDASGGYTVTIDQNGVRYPEQTPPVISTGANRVTALMFVCFGVNDFDCYFAGFNLLEP